MNAPAASEPPHPVSDRDFKKLVAILRLAVPYTGIILSTRESAETRSEVFDLGVSQISAGSRTNPGGYNENKGDAPQSGQFNLGDTRTIDEVIYDIIGKEHIPSFCTACYRLGRIGGDFMDLAKPGLIKKYCHVNAILTFKEYLMDFASPQTREAGEALIAELTQKTKPAGTRKILEERLPRIAQGERDFYI
jgi:2-iminoacetate synthase